MIIPTCPNNVYKDKGWQGYGDWLGTGAVAARLRIYRPFEEARDFVRSLRLKSTEEWISFCRGNLPEKGPRPDDIPATPERIYKDNGWQGIGDWLGTGAIATRLKVYRPFEEAREFVRSLELKSQNEWKLFCKGNFTEKGTLPDDIPSNPNETYKDKGWQGFGDWVGTGTIAPRLKVYRPFEKARAFVRSLHLKNSEEWKLFCRGNLPEKGTLPEDIPAAPIQTYKDEGWEGMGDWLGTGTIANQLKAYRPFEEAREFARSLKLKTVIEWNSFCKGNLPEKGTRPDDIPRNPNEVYRDKGWQSIGDWLGTGAIATFRRDYRPFEEAREFVRSLHLKSTEEWRAFCKGTILEKGIELSLL